MKELIRDNRGIAAVEFALLSIPLFVLIMGSLEIGLQVYFKASAESVLRDAARMAVTGDKTRTGEKGELIDAFVTERLSFTKSTDVDITKVYYDQFSQVRQPEKRLSNATEAPYCFVDINGNQRWDKDPSRTGIGSGDDIIDYKVEVTYNSLFPLVTNVITGKKSMSVTAQTTLRNEPFTGNNDQQQQTCCVSAAPGNPVTCEG
tara:strand:- start:265 stop:876 length:612 start_codon:yes stop_codon:yes gene_type:complete